MPDWTRTGVVLIAVLAVPPVLQAEQKHYTIKDLQALQSREAWDELIYHLSDVPPAERGAEWNRVVEGACLRRVENYLAQYCYASLKGVLLSEPANDAFAWKAGKWARLNQASWSAVPFFAKALTKNNDPRCSDEDVSLAVIAGLGIPSDADAAVVEASKTLAFDRCWPVMKDALKSAFSSETGTFQTNTCGPMEKKGMLSSLQKKRCAQKGGSR